MQPSVPEQPVSESVNERSLEPLAIWALFLSAVLLFPIAAVLGIMALVRIFRSPDPRPGGAVLAAMAVFISAVVAPVAIYAAFQGRGPVTNMCVRVQQEARGTLRVISYLQKGFHEKEGRYGDFKEIGFPLEKTKGPYEYTVDWADKTKFVATAKGTGRMKGDLLQVDNSEKVNIANDRCAEYKRRLDEARQNGGKAPPAESPAK